MGTHVSGWKIRDNVDIRRFEYGLDIVTPLESHEGFYSSNTEAFKLYKEASPMINQYDVTPLYPYMYKTGKVPLGHPTIIRETPTFNL